MIRVSREKWDLFKEYLLEETNSVFETGLILRRVKDNIGNRERSVLTKISHTKTQGNIIYVYSTDGYSFAIDYRKDTKLIGRICG